MQNQPPLPGVPAPMPMVITAAPQQQQQQQQQQQMTTQTVVTTSGHNNVTNSSSAPDLPFMLALACLILNIVFPGTGTLLAAFSVLFPCGQNGVQQSGIMCSYLFIGILQMLLAPFFIGWIWSIITGFSILSASGSTNNVSNAPIATTTVSNTSVNNNNQMSMPQATYVQMPMQSPVMSAPMQAQPFYPPQPVQAW